MGGKDMTADFMQGLQRGAVRLLDGGTGTELQRRGVQMSSHAWCGGAAITSLATLEAIHRDYIAAGADIVTANTYASSRLLLELDGLGDRFEEINRATVQAAHRARRDTGRSDVLIAGSLSHRGPIVKGTARPEAGTAVSLDALAASVSELAHLLRDEGCDLILLEMLYDPIRIPPVLAAAAETGLPVWAGLSARRGADGRVLGFGPGEDVPFATLVSILGDWPVAAAGVMHTPSDLVSDALQILRGGFAGPLMAYPDSGYFRSPDWQFEDVIRPEDLRRFAETWVAESVQILGGCCGLSPEHIAALRPLRREPRDQTAP
jgi:homocysteine S-methyltransferase